MPYLHPRTKKGHTAVKEIPFSIGDFKDQVARLEWIAERRQELDEQEAEARSVIEEILPPVSFDSENDKFIGLDEDGTPVIEWRPTKARRLDQKALKEKFAGVYDYCTVTKYGRSMFLIPRPVEEDNDGS